MRSGSTNPANNKGKFVDQSKNPYKQQNTQDRIDGSGGAKKGQANNGTPSNVRGGQ